MQKLHTVYYAPTSVTVTYLLTGLQKCAHVLLLCVSGFKIQISIENMIETEYLFYSTAHLPKSSRW